VQRAVSASGSQNIEEEQGRLASEILSKKGSGRHLEAEVTEFMEPRFGYDFSNVRVHAGSFAAKTAQDLGAEAFTIGKDVFFGTGRYNPESIEGKKLIAHELTHVVQQGGELHNKSRKSIISLPKDTVEREADHIADKVMSWGKNGDIQPKIGARFQTVKIKNKIQTLLIQMKKGLQVGVYETKDQSKDIDDAVKESIAIPANSIKDAATKLENKKVSEGASIQVLSFYGHGAPGYQSVGAGKGYDPAKEISSESISAYLADYKKMFGALADGARIFLRGCNVGATAIGLNLLKRIKAFCKTQNNIDVVASAWTGKAYHKEFLWVDWWKQTGEMVTSAAKAPKVSWEDHKKLGGKK